MKRRNSSSSSSMVERPAMEKQRRYEMKELYSQLASLLHIPPHERPPLPAFVDQATNSIKELKEMVDGLKAKKEKLEKEINGEGVNKESTLDVVRVSEMDSTLEVSLIIMAKKKVKLFQILSIIEEEGGQVLNASCSTLGHHIYYTIHAQAFQARIGIDASQVEYKLVQLIS